MKMLLAVLALSTLTACGVETAAASAEIKRRAEQSDPEKSKE